MAAKQPLKSKFFAAIVLGDLKTVKEVVPDNPDAVRWETPAGYPPLHMAIMNGKTDIAVYLAEEGADLLQKGEGETAASMADRKGMLEMLNDAAARAPHRRREHIRAAVHGGVKKALPAQRRWRLKKNIR